MTQNDCSVTIDKMIEIRLAFFAPTSYSNGTTFVGIALGRNMFHLYVQLRVLVVYSDRLFSLMQIQDFLILPLVFSTFCSLIFFFLLLLIFSSQHYSAAAPPTIGLLLLFLRIRPRSHPSSYQLLMNFILIIYLLSLVYLCLHELVNISSLCMFIFILIIFV